MPKIRLIKIKVPWLERVSSSARPTASSKSQCQRGGFRNRRLRHRRVCADDECEDFINCSSSQLKMVNSSLRPPNTRWYMPVSHGVWRGVGALVGAGSVPFNCPSLTGKRAVYDDDDDDDYEDNDVAFRIGIVDQLLVLICMSLPTVGRVVRLSEDRRKCLRNSGGDS